MRSAKALIRLALLCAALASPSAHADPISSQDAALHIGDTATVRGRAALTFMRSVEINIDLAGPHEGEGGAVYIDLDGHGEGAPVTGYISRWNRAKFQRLSALQGKVIEMSGRIATFRGQPELFLQTPAQIRTR